jgi:hypothetical protein
MKNIFIIALMFPIYIWSVDSYIVNTPTKKDIRYFIMQKNQISSYMISSNSDSDKNIKEDNKNGFMF